MLEINYPGIINDIANKIANDCVYNDEKFIFYEDVKEILKNFHNIIIYISFLMVGHHFFEY